MDLTHAEQNSHREDKMIASLIQAPHAPSIDPKFHWPSEKDIFGSQQEFLIVTTDLGQPKTR